MFLQLKGVLDLVGSAVNQIQKIGAAREREEAVIGVLTVYFLLKDCVDEGEALVAEAGPEPVRNIERLDANEALSVLARWDAVIRRQGMRLYALQGCILGEQHLSIINPHLQERISNLVGDKMQRTVTLHGIGSALFFRNLFPIADTNAEKARYVALMAGAEGDILDLLRIDREIAGLRESLGEFREVVTRLVSNEELLRLSRRARERANMHEPG